MVNNITQIRKEYVAVFSNNTDFRDKHLTFQSSGGARTSRNTVIQNYPIKGYPYKRGVKLSFEDDYEPCVEAGGGDDLYGICIDINDFSQTATVIPITEAFEGYLVAKKDNQSSINVGDKLCFNANGELEKASTLTNTKVNAIALSKAHKLNDSLYIINVSVFGNRALMNTVSEKTISTDTKGTQEVQDTNKSPLANEQLETKVASLKTHYKDSILKLKQYTKTQRKDRALFSGFENGFQDKMKIIDADALSISSSVDTIEKYSYKGYPYKRAVKLSVENEAVYVVSSNDEDMYGICIDVGESTEVAPVIPITNNFEGYLLASDSSIKIADKLDFDSNGMLIKAGSGGKRMMNVVALSDAFTIDLALEDAKRKGQHQLHFVKVSVYGNSKINAIALSDSIELDSTDKLYVVHVAVYGNKGKPS